jgi:cytochrome c biogenesis protein CcmG/thiol:disulfide interchange protein DsbE
MPRLLLFAPLALFAVLILFLWKGLSLDPRELPSALIDQPFPAFKVVSLLSAERQLSTADLIGRPVLVNVWATWCSSCRQEHEQLLRIAQSNKIDIIGLNYKDNHDSAKKWLATLGNPYQFNIYDASGMLGLDLGVYGAPETYLLDAQSIIRYRHVGIVTEQVWQELQTIMQSWEQ